jgi:16S rRNA (cytidine1402-2'-O)-methyltransferase
MIRHVTGRIVLAATPLGNPRDASPRLVELLATADLIAAEDTRRIQRLASDLGVRLTARIVSNFEQNEQARAIELADAAERGDTVLLVTDAGMPSVSDPGYRAVAEAARRGIDVTVVPGPSAVLVALALSGLPSDRFVFEGFLPRKSGERAARIAELAAEARTIVLFEAPHRLAAALDALAAGLGDDREAAVCRELTKTYEEVRRGPLTELAAWAHEGVRGEITVVVAGANALERRQAAGLVEPEDWVRAVKEREEMGISRKEAIAEVAKAAGVPRREVYDAVVKA